MGHASAVLFAHRPSLPPSIAGLWPAVQACDLAVCAAVAAPAIRSEDAAAVRSAIDAVMASLVVARRHANVLRSAYDGRAAIPLPGPSAAAEGAGDEECPPPARVAARLVVLSAALRVALKGWGPACEAATRADLDTLRCCAGVVDALLAALVDEGALQGLTARASQAEDLWLGLYACAVLAPLEPPPARDIAAAARGDAAGER